LVDRRAGAILGRRMGFLRRRGGPSLRYGRRALRSHARRPLVSGRAAQFRREPAALRRRPRSPRLRKRGWPQVGVHVPPTGPRRRARRDGVERTGGRAGRSRGRLPAQHSRGGDRHARHGEPGGGLVKLLGRLRRAGRFRPLSPDRTQSAVRRRRLYRQRTSRRHARARARNPRAHRFDQGPCRGTVPQCNRHEPRIGPGRCGLGPLSGKRPGRPRHVRATSGRPPSLHSVFVGHDRAPQVHRPHGRRHPAQAPVGARPARQSDARRPLVLFHHHGLDDVELARQRPGGRLHGGALRRFAPGAQARRPL